jgi:hypothetical protein
MGFDHLSTGGLQNWMQQLEQRVYTREMFPLALACSASGGDAPQGQAWITKNNLDCAMLVSKYD